MGVDPSSNRKPWKYTRDKTRMVNYHNKLMDMVRPPPTGLELGGVNSELRESILLYEAAGFKSLLLKLWRCRTVRSRSKKYGATHFVLLNPGGGRSPGNKKESRTS
ncbi:MAG: hypothetical protein IPN87_15710 [Saprospiraceae bacterium]|nr:hypothetical protein [Candidatus Brachybacter algidus]